MHIVVVGTGGVGGYFGAKLANVSESVTFVARGKHLMAIREDGLKIRSAIEGEWTVNAVATDSLESSEIADLVLICVKSYDTESAVKLIKPIVSTSTVILSLQNGIDNEHKIADAFSQAQVMGGVAYIFANIAEPGIIDHHQFGQIRLGPIYGSGRGPVTEQTRSMIDTFDKAGIDAQPDDNIHNTLWEKYVFLVALSGTTAVTRLPVKFIHEVPHVRELWQNQIDELLLLAAADKARIEDGFKHKLVNLLESISPENYSSLYHDLINGKRLELAALHGHAVKLGKDYNIPTPTLSAVLGALSPFEKGAPKI